MTTADFIKKTYNTTSNRERRCSSVFTNHDGTVFSYGYHYPLAFNVKGIDFINTAGYSSTTSKHISWAWRAVGYDATAVKLNRQEAQGMTWYTGKPGTDDHRIELIKTALYRELGEIVEQMASKKRKDTNIFRALQAEHERVYNSVTKLETL